MPPVLERHNGRGQCLMNAQWTSRITSSVARRRAVPIPLSVTDAEYSRSLMRLVDGAIFDQQDLAIALLGINREHLFCFHIE